MLTKTELKEIFSRYDFAPLKRLGENYLIDNNIKDKIIGQAELSKSDIVLEIGPGLGALTIDLAESGAAVFAVEKDKKAFAILNELAGGRFPNLKIFNEDILDFDIKKIAGRRKIKVAGNLPYYITTPIIEYMIENRHLIASAVLMMQREVANRLLAGPGSDDRSSLSCFVQYYTRPAYVHTVRRGSFFPEPEVDSSIIKLDMLIKPPVKVEDEVIFFKIVRGSFNQRGKSIINSLSREAALDMPKDKLAAILKSAGVDPSLRPEVLALEDFARIANEVSK